MSSMLGHACAGIIINNLEKSNRASSKKALLLILLIFLAMLPDIDVVLLLLSANITHRGITHSFLFVFVASLIFSIIFCRYLDISFKILFGLFLAALLSHLVLDYLMGAGPSITLFAPFSSKGFIAPIQLVPCAYYPTSIRGIFQVLTYPPALVGYCLEFLIFVPVILFHRTEKSFVFSGLLLVIFVFAVASTLRLYN